MKLNRLKLVIIYLVCGAATGFAQGPQGPLPWRYQLLEGSFLTADCAFCERPIVPVPLRGSFDLFFVSQGPLFTDFDIRNISFRSGGNIVRGSGTFRIGGQLANIQEMTLNVEVNGRPLRFTNENRFADRRLPNIAISLIETPAGADFYRMDIAASPFREIWFSTKLGFNTTNGTRLGPGDLLSMTGRIVKPNSELLENLGLMPVASHLDIDAVDIAPGGEILFSLSQNQFSETLGQLQHGDALSQRGSVARRNQDLLLAFRPATPTRDYGLDALGIRDDGEVLFSITSNVVSGSLGTTLSKGDLLSSRGQIVWRNSALLSAFRPTVNKDYGLDAVYTWAHGEVWFSTEENFDSQTLGAIQAGDLLSDQGFVVYRNFELASAFGPMGTTDFGLDALFIVTDAIPGAAQPIFTRIAPTSGASVWLEWRGRGRVFQVQRGANVEGPYADIGFIQPDSFFEDVGSLTRPRGFYILKQW